MEWILLAFFIGLIISHHAVKWALKRTPEDDIWHRSVLTSLIDGDWVLFVILYLIAIFY